MFFIFFLLTANALIHTSIPFNFQHPNILLQGSPLISIQNNPLLTINEDFLYFPAPNKIKIRKEFRNLTEIEWNTYKTAVFNLKNSGYLEPLARIHKNSIKIAHNSLEFLPWHSLFLLFFEYLLNTTETQNNPNITIPYWDWTIDSNNPNSSPIFKEYYWRLKECFLVHEPFTHCLKRNKKIDKFSSRKEIVTLLNKKKYNFYEFTAELELIPHALVHLNIGGIDGDMSYMESTNDPLFWHHHSFIELLWREKEYPEDKLDIVLYPFGKTVREAIELKKYVRYE